MQFTRLALFVLSALSPSLVFAQAPGPDPGAINPDTEPIGISTVAKSALTTLPHSNKFGPGMEGASVTPAGLLLAANGKEILSVSDGKQYLLPPASVDQEKVVIASSYVLRSGRVLAADAGLHQVYFAEPGKPESAILLSSKDFLQPNDLVVDSAEKYVYFSGMNYTASTQPGEVGELAWADLTDPASGVKFVAKSILRDAGIHRTNGIEVVKDPVTHKEALYVTSAGLSAEFAVTEVKLFRFDIDPCSGAPTNPRVEFEFLPLLEQLGVKPEDVKDMDPDGITSDTQGSIFLTLNAVKRLLMYHPHEKKGMVIDLETVQFPTNVEFAGEKGDELFIVGKCEGNKESCVDSVKIEGSVGRAWSGLQNVASKRGLRGMGGRMFGRK